MDKKITKKTFLMGLVIAIVVIAGIILVWFCTPKDEKKVVPWWDSTELVYILEDERSVEKSFSYFDYFTGRIEFNYIYDSIYDADNREDYIPKFKVLYNGVEQVVYEKLVRIEYFYEREEGYNFDKPEGTTRTANSPGTYRVYLECYENYYGRDEYGFRIYGDFVTSATIYIFVVRRGEQV